MENQLFASDVMLSFVTLLVVSLIERAWGIQARFHPLTFFSLIAQRMAHKVHLSKSGTPYQQKISGSLAIFMLIAPITTLLVLLIQFAEYPIFFNGLLLLISIYFYPVYSQVKRIQQGLSADKKILSRDQISVLCLRETSTLTHLGMCKASIETLLLRFVYQVIVPLILFMIAGGVGAITYRLIYELNQSWNKKKPEFEHFGKPISALNNLVKWIPVQFALVGISIAGNFIGGLTAALKDIGTSAHQQILAVGAATLKIELGGPVIYGNKKFRFKKFIGRRPDVVDITRALRLINLTQAVIIVLICLLSAILFALGGR